MARSSSQWIELSGVKSSTMGVRVIDMPPIVYPASNGQMVNIIGYGETWQPDGEYSFKAVKRKCRMRTEPNADKLAVLKWLHTAGPLITSDMPTYMQRAVAVTESTFSRFINACEMDTFDVTFTCEPYFYQASQTDITITGGSGSVTNPGNLPSRPKISVTGTGNVTVAIGNTSFSIANLSGTVVVDCDAEFAYQGTADSQMAITLTDHIWPTIPVGSSAVASTGSVTSIVITPNWRWL